RALRLRLPQLPGRRRLPRGGAAVAERAERGVAPQAAPPPAGGWDARSRAGPAARAPAGRAQVVSFTEADARHMARALELARRGLYTTDPNPRVGCVIVKDGRIVGEGWHQRAGEPHAEILALEAAGDRAR